MRAPVTRRAALAGLAAGAGALAAPAVLAQGKGRVVVLGGGFAGATCARALAGMGLAVTMIEADERYVACPFSNLVIHGSRDIAQQTFGFEALRRAGVDVVFARAERIEPDARRVLLSGRDAISYDRLVLAPGIDLRFDALPGYDAAASERMPHAWKAGAQTVLLRKQLEAMDDGGVVVMSVPANPYRCPPGPYERASLIAHYLKTHKPKSKLIVLDAKDAFSKQKLFMAAWQELYPDHLEWVGLASGGKAVEVDAREMTIVTEFSRHKASVANVIPPQRAGSVAQASGLADRSGWCPIDPVSLESRLMPGIHVIGDAAIAGAMPKSAFAANAQAKHCAYAVAAMLRGEQAPSPKLINTCYSLVAPDYGISVAGVYEPAKGLLADVDGAGGTSPGGASREVRAREAIYADAWFKAITGACMARPLAAALLALSWTALPFVPSWAAAQHAYDVKGDAIAAPLGGLMGDAARGRAIVVDRQKGLCLLCHSGPFPEQRFQGDIAPSLAGAGSRLSEGQLRLRMVDSTRINPQSVMPSYYRVDHLTRVAPAFRDKPILEAQEIEDVVAFLATLRDEPSVKEVK